MNAVRGQSTNTLSEQITSVKGASVTSLLESYSFSPWHAPIQMRLAELVDLEDDWDGCGASPVTWEVATYAFQLLDAIMEDRTPIPGIAALPTGGLQIEWSVPGAELELTIEEPGQAEVWAVNNANPHGVEFTVRYDFSRITEPMHCLSAAA